MRLIQRVDEKLTKASLEEKLEKYSVFTLPTDNLPNITPAYSLVPSSSNQFNSKTENVAIERIEFELERDRYFNWIHRAVASLKMMSAR